MDLRALNTRREHAASGAGRRGAVTARAVLIGTRRVLRADYPLEWRPVRTAAGRSSVATAGLETGLTSASEAPPAVRAQVKVLVAAGLNGAAGSGYPPGGRVAAGSGYSRCLVRIAGCARAGSRMLVVSAFHGFGPAIPAMTKLQRMGPSFGKVEGDSG